MGISALKNEKGQILLIVVLASVISLTVGLSVISRTITNTKVTTEQTNSQRALSAAEAGVEQLIQSSSKAPITGTLSRRSASDTSPAQFSATATQVSSNPLQVNGDLKISQHDGADVWLSTYGTDSEPDYSGQTTGQLRVSWTNNSTNCVQNAAIEVVVLSNLAAPSVQRYNFDACATRRDGANGNGFSTPSSGGPSGLGRTYQNTATVTLSGGLLARIIPIYADTYVAVEVLNSAGTTRLTIPPQGYVIESQGTSGNTTRKVRVFQGYPKLPVEYFPYNIFLP